MENKYPSLEEVYSISSKDIPLERITSPNMKVLERFPAPKGDYLVSISFPEFTCKCPRTGHPDFATILLNYNPDKWCVELKSWKYYLNSFRDEGHFHEQVITLIWKDIHNTLLPRKLQIIGSFATRGGASTTVTMGEVEYGS